MKKSQKFENGKKVEGEFEDRKTFVCDVVAVDDDKFDVGQKVLETSSIRFKEKLFKHLGVIEPKSVVKLKYLT